MCDYTSRKTYTAKVKVKARDGSKTVEDTQLIDVRKCDGVSEKGNLRVEKYVKNLSRGGSYQTTAYGNPGDLLSYEIIVYAVSGDVDDVIVRDSLPSKISDARNIQMSGEDVSQNITSLDLGHISEGKKRTITYTATIAGYQEFGYGQTLLTNVASATAKNAYDTAQAKVYVTRQAVEGATVVSTGFTNNPLVDSFVLPMAAALSLVWALKAKILKSEEWLDARKLAYQKYRSAKELGLKIAKVKAESLFNKKI